MLYVRVPAAQLQIQFLISRVAINQRDVPERNQQILLMRSIYSKAERVIGWLGPDENGGSQALKTFETLLRTVIRYPDNFEWVRKMPELLTVNGTFTENGRQYESNHRLEKLLPWLRSSFWRRIWIVQELVLPLSLRLMCGEEFTDVPDPDSFHRTVHRLAKLPYGRPDSVPLQIWMRIVEGMALLRLIAARRLRHLRRDDVVDRIWEGAAGFMNARVQLEFHQTSDPRDHVYGLLGLFDLDIVPDYGEDMTVGDVYLEVARRCLKTEFRDILTLAGTRHSCSGSDCLTHLDSPSWVPDWRLATPARNRLDRYPKSHAFPSDGGLQMQIIDYKWLRGSAVVWDTVSKTEFKVGWDLTEWDLAERIDIEKPGDRAYPSGITRFQAIIILWHGGYDGSKAGRCDLQPGSELFRSYEVIFYANIAKPWTNKHGLSEKPKLVHHVIGGNDLTFRATSIPKDHRESYVARSRQLRYGMRCFHTEKGYIGFGPLTTEVGQLICVLEGHKAPVLLERSDSHYLFVGDCDVVGIMNGEVLEVVKRGEAETTDIEIR